MPVIYARSYEYVISVGSDKRACNYSRCVNQTNAAISADVTVGRQTQITRLAIISHNVCQDVTINTTAAGLALDSTEVICRTI